jgi:hypothetical protein
MNARVGRLPAVLGLVLCGLLVPASSSARRPKRGLPARTTVAPARPPSPATVVQVGGLRPGAGRPAAAVLHAIQRDAMPDLQACYAGLGAPRSMVHVELAPREGGSWGPSEVVSSRRHRALEGCVREAVERIAVPPSEEAVEEPVRFELAFGMPPFGARRPAVRARP